MWDDTFYNTPLHSVTLIVGTRNNPNLGKEVVRRNPFSRNGGRNTSAQLITKLTIFSGMLFSVPRDFFFWILCSKFFVILPDPSNAIRSREYQHRTVFISDESDPKETCQNQQLLPNTIILP